MWVGKYRPKRLEEMIGNEEARLRLVSWLKEWEEGDKAALLIGPPGTGKTTLVHLAAEECEANLVELNASDSRTKAQLGKKIGEALSSSNLFDSRSLIFLDEVDGLAGRADYGAVEFIKDAVKTSKHPVVMAANDPDSDQVKKLSSVSLTIPLKPPPPRQVELFLRHILESEGASADDERLREIAVDSHGDLRYAINSLQSKRTRTAGSKNIELSVGQSLNSFFEAQHTTQAVEALRAVPLAPDEKVREIFRSIVNSNLPPEKISKSLGVISRADVLMGRIRRGRNWRILRYLDGALANDLLPIVRNEGVTHTEGDLPWNILLRVWNDSKKVNELAKRYAASSHTSARSARIQDLPYLLYMSGTRKFKRQLISGLDLDETFEKFVEKESRNLR